MKHKSKTFTYNLSRSKLCASSFDIYHLNTFSESSILYHAVCLSHHWSCSWPLKCMIDLADDTPGFRQWEESLRGFFTWKRLHKSLMNSFFQLPVQPCVSCKDATQMFPHISVYLNDDRFLRLWHCLYLWMHLQFNWVGWTMSLLLLHLHSFEVIPSLPTTTTLSQMYFPIYFICHPYKWNPDMCSCPSGDWKEEVAATGKV